jgi:DNA-binding MarR family transcriptional regulator
MVAIATNTANILYTVPMSSAGTGSEAIDVKWLDDREMRAWRGYIETIGDLQNALEGDLADVGLTVGDYQVLVYLSEQDDERMRMCDLATLLHLSPSGLTRRLDGLVRMGAVAREPCPDDRRATLASLTPSGRRLLENVAPQHVMSVRKHFIDALTPRQIDVLGDVFEALRRHFSAETTE